jgi:arsenate reductase-like glutaredoxin family protein
MPATITWHYQRKACTTCKRAQAFIAQAACPVAETVDATKVRYDPPAALKLLVGITKLVAMKGKKVVEFDLVQQRPDDATLIGVLIGPTGNLRAPTLKVGSTLLVGFDDETYQQYLS